MNIDWQKYRYNSGNTSDSPEYYVRYLGTALDDDMYRESPVERWIRARGSSKSNLGYILDRYEWNLDPYDEEIGYEYIGWGGRKSEVKRQPKLPEIYPIGDVNELLGLEVD